VRNILAKSQQSTLQHFLASTPLVAFDFDGTLAPEAKNPRSARLRHSTRRALAKVADRYPTVVISGRARADVLARLDGVALKAVVGNHGLEPSPDAARYHALVKSWLPSLRNSLEATQGVEIENKLYSVAIHYRRAKAKRGALAAIQAAIGALGPDARGIEDKLVVNLLPSAAPNKGSALLTLQRSFEAETVIFVGDDAADEDVFAAQGPEHLLGIRVGRPTRTAASFYLTSQTDIDRLLVCLADA
jgi:trehalose 6-phosphate phosphatase